MFLQYKPARSTAWSRRALRTVVILKEVAVLRGEVEKESWYKRKKRIGSLVASAACRIVRGQTRRCWFYTYKQCLPSFSTGEIEHQRDVRRIQGSGKGWRSLKEQKDVYQLKTMSPKLLLLHLSSSRGRYLLVYHREPVHQTAGISKTSSLKEFKDLRKTYHKRVIWGDRWANGQVVWRDD
ncbi:hypothetical protein ARMSODRAFT_970859 [Armillaria solidipes]|uniref:Uncharacterized protein n=1 Tax=Armillaria solidipes TaxID=1076256 RepID=A0A2H3CHR1_9AGAR|nr:hypothetical protein ARMSODRAFT_970859 [Armillaria solidipes]